MNQLEDAMERIEKLERELAELKADRFANLTVSDVEKLKENIFERTASNVSGTIDGALIVTIKGQRRALATYPNFPPA